MTKNKRVFCIRYKDSGETYTYTKVKTLYSENHLDIGITIGALMNALCGKNVWENDKVKITRNYVISMIECDNQLVELNINEKN